MYEHRDLILNQNLRLMGHHPVFPNDDREQDRLDIHQSRLPPNSWWYTVPYQLDSLTVYRRSLTLVQALEFGPLRIELG